MDFVDEYADIGQHEERLLVGREQIAALFGKVDSIRFLVDDEVEALVYLLHILIAHEVGFDATDQAFDAFFLQ